MRAFCSTGSMAKTAGGKTPRRRLPKGHAEDNNNAVLLAEKKGLMELRGLPPNKPTSTFCIVGQEAYAIDPDCLLSLSTPTIQIATTADGRFEGVNFRAPGDVSAAINSTERALISHWVHRYRMDRKAITRTRLNIKVGAPFHTNTSGETHTFQALKQDLVRVQHTNQPKCCGWVNQLDPYCTNADVIARYAGHRALTDPNGAQLFMILFLLNGTLDLATRPTADSTTDEHTQFTDQQSRVALSISRLYLLYPQKVEPCVDAQGRAYPLGQFSMLSPPNPCAGIPGHQDDDMNAPSLCCFASLVCDKRPGAPWHDYTDEAMKRRGLCCDHDTKRLWILSPRHVVKVRTLLKHYDLERRFPALATLSKVRDETILPLVRLRKHYLDLLGDPPEQLDENTGCFEAEWREKRVHVPFGNPWVSQCKLGCTVSIGILPLVPLIKGSAQEKNGTPWLDVDALHTAPRSKERDDHFVDVMTVLASLLGRQYVPKKRAAHPADLGTKPKRVRYYPIDDAARTHVEIVPGTNTVCITEY